MRTRREFAGGIVNFIVGPAAQVFAVHRQKLNGAPRKIFDLMKPQSKRLSKDIRLRDDDAEAFGLLLEWLYERPLPYFGLWMHHDHSYACAIQNALRKLGTPMLWFPARMLPEREQEHFAVPDACGSSRVGRMDHIYSVKEYARFSPEEMRWIETASDGKSVADFTEFLCDSADLPDGRETSRSRPSTAYGSDELSGNTSQIREFLVKEGMIQENETRHRIDGEYVQLCLLKLIIFAAKYQWDELLSDAMDAYHTGERHMARSTIPTRHVELVYEFAADTKSPAGTTIVKFMADYAFYIGKYFRKQSSWVSIGLKHLRFMEDIMRREDGSCPVSGYDISTGVWDRDGPQLPGRGE